MWMTTTMMIWMIIRRLMKNRQKRIEIKVVDDAVPKLRNLRENGAGTL